MNNFINFKTPEFFEKYGQDWAAFKSIIEEAVDHYLLKVWSIVYYNNLNTMSEKALEVYLQLIGLPVVAGDTYKNKKLKARSYVSQYKNKGLEDFYLDLQENIFGVRGEMYSGYTIGTTRWNVSRWNNGGILFSDIRWSNTGAQFEIYINCMTDTVQANNSSNFFRWYMNKWNLFRWTDTVLISALLDNYVELLRLKSNRPAFYRIYLVDSGFNILRTV